jgi:hypothetical protein
MGIEILFFSQIKITKQVFLPLPPKASGSSTLYKIHKKSRLGKICFIGILVVMLQISREVL